MTEEDGEQRLTDTIELRGARQEEVENSTLAVSQRQSSFKTHQHNKTVKFSVIWRKDCSF